jgi:hypothetical protein
MFIFRVLLGFLAASIAAGLTLVLFVYTPAELVHFPSDRLWEVGLLSLAVATHSAKFAAPLALVFAIIGEGRKISSWTYYVLASLFIAAIGFLAQHYAESIGQPTILNNYALIAFLTTGVVAGWVYWLFSGRYVRRETARPDEVWPAPAAQGEASTSPKAAASQP